MRARVAKHFNDIVSLIVMGLMITALVAGQAAGAQQKAAHAFEDDDARILLAELRAEDDELVLDVDFRFRPQGE